jgi:hypothetical protein
MIRYSHVSLSILCNTRQDADFVTAHLGTQPSQVRESKSHRLSKKTGREERTHFSWSLDSPKSAEQADPTGRLWALANAIEPFGERLLSLDAQFHRHASVIYHLTPQQPTGIAGEFNWLWMPAALMRRFTAWNLDVSYEVIWFNHPDWVKP